MSWPHVEWGLTSLSSPTHLNFLCREAGCLQGEGPAELGNASSSWCLTGKSWYQDLNDLYGRLEIKKHSSLFMSPWLHLGLQSQHAFQLWLTEPKLVLPASCSLLIAQIPWAQRCRLPAPSIALHQKGLRADGLRNSASGHWHISIEYLTCFSKCWRRGCQSFSR